MPVVVNLDVMLAKRKVRSHALAAAICRYLDCKPGDLLDYEISDDDLPG